MLQEIKEARNKILLISCLALLYGFIFTACDGARPCTTPKIINVNPVTFKLDGDCKMIDFSVLEITYENLLNDKHDIREDKVIWRIKRDGEITYASIWPEIIYGAVPKFYIQEIPEKGTPPPFSEGKYYIALPHLTSAWGTTVIFTVENGKIKVIPNSELRKLKAENNP